LVLCNCIEPNPPTHPLSNTEILAIVSSFPNVEMVSFHQFQIPSLPSHIPSMRQLKKLSLEYLHVDITEVEKVVQSCPKLEELVCIALRSLESDNNLLISSSSLQYLSIRESLVSKIIVNNAPLLKKLCLSYLRNSDLLFSILGNCEQFSSIEVKKCDGAITESIVNAIILASKSPTTRIKYCVKVRSWYSGSLEDVENEIFWNFQGHVAMVRTATHKKKRRSPDLCNILKAIKESTKCGMLCNNKTSSSSLSSGGGGESRGPACLTSSNVFFRTNFPFDKVARGEFGASHNKCLVIFTNVKNGRVLSN